ncbi:hypothetical protein [Thalassospira sp. TSL5-1]|nr:hypothetical protein [Thalassospira sp. TSL5-1]
MDLPIAEILQGGGNLASIALVLIMWRFDRRLLKLEIQLSGEH